MFSAIKDLFRLSDQTAEPSATLEATIKNTAIAVLLIEVARVDSKLEKSELIALKAKLAAQFNLDTVELENLVSEAKREQSDSVSLQHYTKQVHQLCNDAEKFELLTGMWQVAFADGELDKYEEHLIRKVAELLYIPHSEFIRAKQMARVGTDFR